MRDASAVPARRSDGRGVLIVMLRMAVLGLLLLSMQGCAAVRLARLALGTKVVTVSPVEMTFCGLQADGVHLEVGLSVENLTSGEAVLQEVRMDVLLDDVPVVSAARQERLCIPPRGSVHVRVPVVLDPVKAFGEALAPDRTFAVAGTVTVDLGLLGARSFSFRSAPRKFPGGGPRLKLEGASLTTEGLGAELCLTLTMRCEGLDPSVRSFSLHGQALVNGRRIAAVDQEHTGQPDESFEVRIVIPPAPAARVTAQAIRTRKLDLKVDVLFEAEAGAWKFRIPYVFDRKGVTFGRHSESDGQD